MEKVLFFSEFFFFLQRSGFFSFEPTMRTEFKWQPFLYFSLICYPAHISSHRDFISHILKYLFFFYIHTQRNNATVTYFLKLMTILFEIHILFTSHSCALTYGPLRLSCVFLANYMPKCQMSSGPYGPIFWPIWFINQRALYNHALSSLVLPSVHTSPSHRVRLRNFIFGMNMPICP